MQDNERLECKGISFGLFFFLLVVCMKDNYLWGSSVNIYLFIKVQVEFDVRNAHLHYYLVSVTMFAVKLTCGVYLSTRLLTFICI